VAALEDEVRTDPVVKAAISHPDENRDVYLSGVVHDGVLYRSDCRTAAGPFPYCDEMRHGVWSVTKSAMLNVALLRLAEKYGAGILDESIADLRLRGSSPRLGGRCGVPRHGEHGLGPRSWRRR
jgi:hypothetical protein